ncbi:hypothetical protein [Halomicrobium katesii]|uniref:hypothetical protein n=1 Tax=Halomicrobium katesii TaxID=437163 RepID=UPI00036EFF17|nr:hypothetical protein [Halomicrobium katesii]
MSDPEPEQKQPDDTPENPSRSRWFRAFRWLTENLTLLASGLGLGVFILASVIGYELPRNLKIIGLTAVIIVPIVGRPTGKKVRSLLWEPAYVWLVDIDARETDGGIFRVPGQRFNEWTVTEGQLDWVSPDLAFGKQVDLETQTVEGTWRGTMSGRELMKTLQAVEECRGQLEEDAKRGFAIEAQAFTIIRNATRKAVMQIVSTFERGTLPDEGQGLTDEIDSAIEQFGLERKIRDTEEDDSPQSDSPGVRIDFDQDLADLADAGNGGAPADD